MKHFLESHINPNNLFNSKLAFSEYDLVLEICNNISRTHLTLYTLFANKNASHGGKQKRKRKRVNQNMLKFDNFL